VGGKNIVGPDIGAKVVSGIWVNGNKLREAAIDNCCTTESHQKRTAPVMELLSVERES
jgi:hypothetical protein